MRRLARVAALAAAALACGQTDDEKLMNARRSLCESAVGTTVSDVSSKWGYRPDEPAECSATLVINGDNSRCDASAPRCVVTWKEVLLTNGTDCNPIGGCAYMCQAYTAQPDTGPTQDPTALETQTICGTAFSTGQIPVL